MQYAIKALENVVKTMSCKVLNLEEEIVKIQEESKENEQKDLEKPFKDVSEFLNSTNVSAKKKFRIQETKHLSTGADSSTNITIGWTKNTQKNDFLKKRNM